MLGSLEVSPIGSGYMIMTSGESAHDDLQLSVSSPFRVICSCSCSVQNQNTMASSGKNGSSNGFLLWLNAVVFIILWVLSV
jgi:hypothetical protein